MKSINTATTSAMAVVAIAAIAFLPIEDGHCAITMDGRGLPATMRDVHPSDGIAQSILALQKLLVPRRDDDSQQRQQVCVNLPSWEACWNYVTVCVTFPYFALRAFTPMCVDHLDQLKGMNLVNYTIVDYRAFFDTNIYNVSSYRSVDDYTRTMDWLDHCPSLWYAGGLEKPCNFTTDRTTARLEGMDFRARLDEQDRLAGDHRTVNATIHAMRLLRDLDIRHSHTSLAVYVRMCHHKPDSPFYSDCCDREAYKVEMKHNRCSGKIYNWRLDKCVRANYDCHDECYDGCLEKIGEHRLCTRNEGCTIDTAKYITHTTRVYDICVGDSIVKRVDCGPTGHFSLLTLQCMEDDVAHRWMNVANFSQLID